MPIYQSIDNLSLIKNGLFHIKFEMKRSRPSMFRVARESHLVLYRSMIEALKGSANLAISGRQPKDRLHRYRLGEEPWKEIYKVPIQGCDQAWRFSTPILRAKPKTHTMRNSRSKKSITNSTMHWLFNEYYASDVNAAQELSMFRRSEKLEWLHNFRKSLTH